MEHAKSICVWVVNCSYYIWQRIFLHQLAISRIHITYKTLCWRLGKWNAKRCSLPQIITLAKTTHNLQEPEQTNKKFAHFNDSLSPARNLCDKHYQSRAVWSVWNSHVQAPSRKSLEEYFKCFHVTLPNLKW